MKKFKLLLLSALALGAVYSCSKDDEDDKTEEKYEVNFKSQKTQGLIDGNAFEYIKGTFKDDLFNDGEYKITLFDLADYDTTLLAYGTKYQVYMTLPAQVGTYELTATGDYVTLKNGTINQELPLARKGAVEIISISETELVGKIDAYYDDENYVNGNFTVSFCD